MSSDRCYQCNTKFSLFKKGKPCHKCALLHCDGCLTGAKATTNALTCRRCAEAVKSRDVRAPPKALVERMKKQNETPPKYSDAMGQHIAGAEGNTIIQKSSGVSTDEEIATRLAKLSQGSATGGVPSDDQLRERLARLKGSYKPGTANEHEPSSNWSHRNTVQHNDVYLQQDPMKTPDDLIEKMREELAVDKGRSSGSGKDRQRDVSDLHMQQGPIKSPEDLIGKMREEIAIDRSRNPAALGSDDEEDEEAATRKLIQKILEEDALEREIGCRLPVPSTLDPGTSTQQIKSEENELPWCVVCNEDASVRCVDPECEASLYCLRCFAEDHRDSDRMNHAKIKYTTRS